MQAMSECVRLVKGTIYGDTIIRTVSENNHLANVAMTGRFHYADGDHWCRIIMNFATQELISRLDTDNMSALEISGSRWKNWPFKNYTSIYYPGFDILSDVIFNTHSHDGDVRFDIIILEQVLEHIAKPQIALKNIYSMLKDDGYILLTVPFLLRIHGCPNDYSRWSEQGIISLLSDSKFLEKKITSGSWGNRDCLIANLDSWPKFDPGKHSLENEPNFPVVVWALAQK
jgi:SAM-dependent methyltransferase